MDFSNSTLINVKKEARKVSKKYNVKYKQALDEVSIKRGFKSYKDLIASFNIWLKNKLPVCFVLKASTICKINFTKSEKDEYNQSKEINIDELNNVQKFGLKKQSFNTALDFKNRYEINENKYFNLIEKDFEEYLFFDYNLKKVNIEKLKKDFTLRDGTIFQEAYDEQLFWEIQEDTLIVKKFDKDNYAEELLLFSEFTVFNNKIFDNDNMLRKQEQYGASNSFMTSDFYN